ncbi:MAG: hypothetical protein U1E84_01140 [Rhodoferax sp.]
MAMFFLLLPALAAVMAGLAVAGFNRHQVLEDGPLIRQFLVAMAVFVVVLVGVSKSHTVRMRLDPVYKLQTELAADPVLQALREHAPDDAKKLENLLILATNEGHSLARAKALTRPVLSMWARYRVSFADHGAVLQWAQVHIDSLKELRARDPALCVQYLLPPTAESLAGLTAFSTGNMTAFEQAVVRLYASANQGMRHTGASSNPPVELEVLRAHYAEITEQVLERYGLRFGEGTAKATPDQLKADTPARVCDAYLYRLEAMQARPAPVAARLLQAALRD